MAGGITGGISPFKGKGLCGPGVDGTCLSYFNAGIKPQTPKIASAGTNNGLLDGVQFGANISHGDKVGKKLDYTV